MELQSAPRQEPADEWQYHPRFGKPAWYLYLGGTPAIAECVQQVACGPFVGWRTCLHSLPWAERNRTFATAEDAMAAVDEARGVRESNRRAVPPVPPMIVDAFVRLLEGR